MNSKERIMAAIEGKPADHLPLTTWCFGICVPEELRWERAGRRIRHWYSMRMEHIHTLSEPWTLEDDFKRAERWLKLGADDVLDVSVPWSHDVEVTWTDSAIRDGQAESCPILVREYQTPSGPLRHAVCQTAQDAGPGWVIQPPYVALFEDYNVPRGVEHAVSTASDVPVIRHLYGKPDDGARSWFADRMAKVQRFADEKGVLVQAWSAFGMDAVVWLAGTEGAIMMAVDAPDAFERLVNIVAETDYARTELAAMTEGVDMLVERGWYSSTDLWSPGLFDKYVFVHLKVLVDLAHKWGKKFAYVMTTGVEILGPRLADAGVDMLYFVDPVQDKISLEKAKELLSDRMTLVGGTNALSLACGDHNRIRTEIRQAVDILGPTNRFILHPVDALFPDTPWQGVEQMLEAWREFS